MPLRDVIGHNRLIGLLERSIAGGTLPPSLLFAGPAGVGKRTTAVAFAQALNCLAPRDGDACGVCAACSRIARGVHPDVVLVAPEDSGAIRIEQVRDIVDRAAYRPFEGRRRVVIIDEADALGVPPQHALLKTLEEPPSSSIFILVTSRPDVLLPTVRSRCPQLRFRPLSPGDIASALIARGMPEREAHAVAATADGSLADAIGASGGELVEAREIAHRVLAHAAAHPEPARRIEAAKELLAKTGAGGAADRVQLSSYLRAMASLLRDLEVLATGAAATALANPDARPALERLTSTYQRERGVRAFAAVDRALAALAPPRNAGVKIVADWVVLQL
jgi:DNA polymerase III subunit delta'